MVVELIIFDFYCYHLSISIMIFILIRLERNYLQPVYKEMLQKTKSRKELHIDLKIYPNHLLKIDINRKPNATQSV